MSNLFQKLRIHQVFGANTNVGKTILTTSLVRASAQRGKKVFYLKPVSTGPLEDADDLHVNRYTTNYSSLINSECLFRYDEPVSPHLAVKLRDAESSPPSDGTFVDSVADRIRTYAQSCKTPAHMYLETAGGVHSPTLSGTSQADCYRPLFLPTILIGDSKLGGISSTISSYESLLLRGYIIDSVVLFHDEYYRNWEYLKPYFADGDVIDHLDTCHTQRLQELESMPSRALDSIWWPFVQHGLVQGEKNVNVIDSAHGDFFSVTNKTALNDPSSTQSVLSPQFDGSASWWTQTFGHAHPSLTLAAARASGRYGHVMFPQAVHLPALKLAERLIQNGPGKGWASRAFFSDNGSTGMEVAIKMALRAFTIQKKELGVLGLKGSYHGDTIGVMDACEEGVYTCEWHDAKGFWFDPPTIGIKDGEVLINIPGSLASFSNSKTVKAESLSWVYEVEIALKQRGGPKLAALVIEPLLMGAGGMLFVDPLFQRVLVDTVRGRRSGASAKWSGLPVIFDEVFVGLNRIGMESTGPLLGVYPDISVNAKVLTGGLIPLAVTLASQSIFEAFLGDSKAEALLHGHSYTAHPIGCEVANEALSMIDKLSLTNDWISAQECWAKDNGEKSPVWSLWDPNFIQEISKLPQVKEVMTLGSVLSIKVEDNAAGYVSHSAQALFQSLNQFRASDGTLSSAPGGAPFGIHFRTLGDVAYFMTSLNTKSSVIRSIEDRIWETLTST
ncbi:pyridoxal phosphate-dependent transferase [Pholiota molesta]|nr:pyridoxal phosphate-dependent transferase [Pholiota molesta]